MRRPKEIIVLVVLLAAAMVFVLWYVIDRRARMRAESAPPVAGTPGLPPPAPAAGSGPRPLPGRTPSAGPVPSMPAGDLSSGPVPSRPGDQSMTGPVPPSGATEEPVPLGGANERKTIDFSGGKAVVKDSPEDRAAIDAAVKDIREATAAVTFEARPKAPPSKSD